MPSTLPFMPADDERLGELDPPPARWREGLRGLGWMGFRAHSNALLLSLRHHSADT